MNKLEAEYAGMLDADPAVAEHWFEAFKIRLADNTFYTPDFLVRMIDDELVVHEVKGGLFTDAARIRLRVAAEHFPARFVLAQKKNKATGWEIGDV